MGRNIRATLALLLLPILASAATHRHHPALHGAISPTGDSGQTQPVVPVFSPIPAAAPTSTSLVSHGSFLYAMVGDKVYKLDPRVLHVLSVTRLGEPRTSKMAAKVKKGTRRRVVED